MSNKPNALFMKLDGIERQLDKLYQKHWEPHWYNPWELVKNIPTSLEIIWRYKGSYTRNMKELYELVVLNVANPNNLVKYPTFCKYLNDESKAAWMNMMGIQAVFAVRLRISNYLITTDGTLVSADKLTKRSSSSSSSYINLVVEGERVNLNLAALVWKIFVNFDSKINEDLEFYFIDENVSNCALYNLGVKTPKYEKE
jgi:hypothetical protein